MGVITCFGPKGPSSGSINTKQGHRIIGDLYIKDISDVKIKGLL